MKILLKQMFWRASIPIWINSMASKVNSNLVFQLDSIILNICLHTWNITSTTSETLRRYLVITGCSALNTLNSRMSNSSLIFIAPNHLKIHGVTKLKVHQRAIFKAFTLQENISKNLNSLLFSTLVKFIHRIQRHATISDFLLSENLQWIKIIKFHLIFKSRG